MRAPVTAGLVFVLVHTAFGTLEAQRGGGGGNHTFVTPDFGGASAWAGTSGNTVVFKIANTSAEWESYDLTCARSGLVSSCAPTVSAIGVPANDSVQVTVSYSTTADVGSGQITLTATSQIIPLCEEFDCPPDEDSGAYTVTVTPGPPPTVSLVANSLDRRNYSQCLHACLAATHAQGTVPYTSNDTPRSVTLAYNSDRTTPRQFVYAEVSHGNPGYLPVEYRLRVIVKNGAVSYPITFVNGQDTLFFSYPGAASYRIGGQFDVPSALGTGVYRLEVHVTSIYPSGSILTTVATGRLPVLDERNSSIARGWTVAGLQRVYSQGDTLVLIAEGDGSYTTFVKVGSSWQRPAGDFSKFAIFAPEGKYVRTYPDSTKAIFRIDGLMSKLRDRFGNETGFTYDASGRLQYVVENNRWTQLQYGTYGLASIKDPFNRYTYATVDASRRLTAIQDPDGVSTTFGYDTQLRLSTITNRRSETSTILYNDTTQLVSGMRSPAVAVHGVGGLQQLTTTFDAWHRDGIPYASTSSTARFAPVRPDSVDGRVTDPSGRVVRYRQFSAQGQPFHTHLPYGNVITRIYGSTGLLAAVSNDPFGPEGSYTYDQWGKLTYSSEEGIERFITYNPGHWSLPDSIWGGGEQGQKLFVTTGKVDSIRYGSVSGQQWHEMRWMKFAYTATGRLIKTVDSEGHLVRQTVYAGTNGNRSKDSMPGNRTLIYGYNTYGQRIRVQRPDGKRDSVVYDVLNRPIKTFDAVNANPTLIGYDNLYRTSVTDPMGQVYAFSYDATGARTSRTHPGGPSEQYAYGWNRELLQYTNRRGQVVSFAYDSLLRRTRRWGTNLAEDTLVYSANGLTVTARSAVSIETVYRNERGQPDSVKTVYRDFPTRVYWRRYGYNGVARLTSVLGTGSSVSFASRTYGWSTSGALTSVAFGGSSTTFALNRDDVPTSFTLPDNATINQASTSVHGPGWRATTAGYWQDVERWMENDSLDQLRRHYWNNRVRASQFGYDGLGRLTESGFYQAAQLQCQWLPDYGYWCDGGYYTADSTHYYGYDAVGNWTHQNGQLVGYYGTGNKIQTFGTCGYSTDNDGNVTSRTCNGVTFTWDALNRLTQYTANGSTITLAYDGFGQLVRRTGGTLATEHYLWDRQNVYAILDATGTSIRSEYSYYPGVDDLHAIRTGSVNHYAHTDGIGNVVVLTSPSQGVVRTYVYSEWGADIGGFVGSWASKDRARFKGALWMGPELDFYFMRNRWYEPKTGRFLSQDPIGIQGGINLYAFGGSDPINYWDPYGTFGLGDVWKGIKKFVTSPFGAVVAITVTGGLSGMTWGAALLGGAKAVGAAGLNSALAAGFESTATGRPFFATFYRNWQLSSWYLGGGAIVAGTLGGGLLEVGTNGLFQGYVRSRNSILGSCCAMTFGGGAVMNPGPNPGIGYLSDLFRHEYGHTVQFLGLSLAVPWLHSPWVPYTLLGAPGFLGWHDNPWERMATHIGG